MVRTGRPSSSAAGSGRLTEAISLGVLARLIHPDLVDEVIAEQGRKEQRIRLLPARVVVYYVLALCLFFGESYEEVMRRLVGGLEVLRFWQQAWRVPTTGAITQARARLGAGVLAKLFARVARPLAGPGTPSAWLAGRRLMAIDGTVVAVPDTPANDGAFGRLGGARQPAPYPQVLVVGLAECGTHALVDAAIGGCREDERALAAEVLGSLAPGMLLMADRGFYSYDFWEAAHATGADLLWRLQAGIPLAFDRALADGSWLAVIARPRDKRAHHDHQRGKGRKPTTPVAKVTVRVIEYEVTDRGKHTEDFCLITTILDPDEASAAELAAAYHQRWEAESAFAQLKTRLLDGHGVLRSKSPEMVRQELWALLLVHYAICDLITHAAATIDHDPDQLSFLRAVRVARRHVTAQAALSPPQAHPNPDRGPGRDR